MEDQLRIYRQILYDLAQHYLEPLQGNFSRLAYVAGLRGPVSGAYEEKTLSKTYGGEPVHQALAKCHEELFERALELSLAQQQRELTRYFEERRESGLPVPEEGGELLESWIPLEAPDYLKELFRSNLRALFELLHERKSKARSGT